MTIPTSDEIQSLLNEIATEMASVKSAMTKVQAVIQPLHDERESLKETVKKADNKLNEESEYAYKQRAASYELYKQIERMWEDYVNSCRNQRDTAIAGINTRLAEIRTELWDSEVELKRLQREYDSLERRWDAAQRKIKDAEQYASIKDRMDKLTIGAPWREWAKDHQIDGGRRIAYRGKLLLGDTMGLGKTLTSVIAMDFIRAMTAEADAEHPVVIETN